MYLHLWFSIFSFTSKVTACYSTLITFNFWTLLLVLLMIPSARHCIVGLKYKILSKNLRLLIVIIQLQMPPPSISNCYPIKHIQWIEHDSWMISSTKRIMTSMKIWYCYSRFLIYFQWNFKLGKFIVVLFIHSYFCLVLKLRLMST